MSHKNVVFLAHWSLAFVEEQFYALYSRLSDANQSSDTFIYFCQWNSREAVDYLVHQLFVDVETDKKWPKTVDLSDYPLSDNNNSSSSGSNVENKEASAKAADCHQLQGCTRENTLFVVQFNPRHLKFFLRSTGSRFAQRYAWWQIEQCSNKWFFNDSLYRRTVHGAVAVLEFSRFNKLDSLPDGMTMLYAPFSRSSKHLLYSREPQTQLDCWRRDNICRHQRRRLLQDNPSFASVMPKVCIGSISSNNNNDAVLLLGTCDVDRRRRFKKMCTVRGVQIVHPYKHSYLFGFERQQYIQQFSVAVNIHQYEPSALEQAKLYLLLVNGCETIVSEKSHSAAENAMIETTGKGRIVLADSMQGAAETLVATLLQRKQQSGENRGAGSTCSAEEQDKWHYSHFKRLSNKLKLLCNK